MSTALTVSGSSFADLDEIQRAAKLMLASGYFETQRDPAVGIAQLAVKILAGREMGYGPFASVQGIHVIQGKPALSANLMAAAVKASPRYDYRVRTMSDKEVAIEFFEKGQSVGVSTFTLADAQKAGVKNVDKFPRNMLFARAMSNGVRWFCPDVFSGNAVYVAEELGDDTSSRTVDYDTGEIIEAEAAQPAAPVTVVTLAPQPPAPQPADDGITDKQLKMLHALGTQVYNAETWKTKRGELVEFVTKGRAHSASDLTKDEAARLIDGLMAKKNAGQVVEAPPGDDDLAQVEPLAF